jgi:N-acetylglucosamine-6-phosphate deacetylase
MSAPADDILRAVTNVANTRQPFDGAQHLGVHVEGPFLSRKFPGAQPASVLRDPDSAEYRTWFDTRVVRLITVAPELDGTMGLIHEGIQHGIAFAAGHTSASYEQILAAADQGVLQATHTFNAMLGLHHRNPGTLGAVLTDDRIYAQIIADGVHTHPAMVKLLVRAKGADRTLLITDAMRATGLRDGTYTLGDQPVTVQDSIARTLDGALAGSTATLDYVLRNVIAFAGVTLNQALQMATTTPAEAMHIQARKGSLVVGKDADVIFLDSALRVRMTLIAGRVVYATP